MIPRPRSTTKPSRRALCLGAAALLLLPAGCRYGFVRPGAFLPEGVKTIHVPVFRNLASNPSEPGAENLFTEALRTQVAQAGLEAPRGEASDAELEGDVNAISFVPTAVGGFRLTAVAQIRLVHRGQVVRSAQVSGSEEFFDFATTSEGQPRASDPVLQPEANRQVVLSRLADTLMRDAFTQLALSN